MRYRIEQVEAPKLKDGDFVTVKSMGNITEIRHLSRKNTKANIKKLDSESYVVIATGEIKEFNHIENRADDKKSVSESLKRLRDLINTNVIDTDYCRWITLTYAENMTDTKRLYADFKKFNMKYRYWHEQTKKPKYEYIVAMEPQGRGAWHAHVIFIYPQKAPYIKNADLAEIWGHGFVTVKALKEVDNVGAYLTAYLGDMELSEAPKGTLEPHSIIKEVEYEDDSGQKKTKHFIKGARLNMYPPGFNIYRMSRGIKQPIETIETEEEAQKKVSASTLTFIKSILLTTEDDSFENTIYYRYYNSARKSKQE